MLIRFLTKKRARIFVLAFFTLCSCGQSKNDEVNIVIDASNPKEVQLSELTDNNRAIQLDESSVPLSRIHNIKCFDNP